MSTQVSEMAVHYFLPDRRSRDTVHLVTSGSAFGRRENCLPLSVFKGLCLPWPTFTSFSTSPLFIGGMHLDFIKMPKIRSICASISFVSITEYLKLGNL